MALRVIWPEAGQLTEALTVATADDRLRSLTEAVLQRWVSPDPLVRTASRLLAGPYARITSIASELGLSERHLNRRMNDAIGYGPKIFARVARLRRLIAVSGDSLADRAYRAGYASQSHMSDEVRRLTGLTPVRFLEDASLTSA